MQIFGEILLYFVGSVLGILLVGAFIGSIILGIKAFKVGDKDMVLLCVFFVAGMIYIVYQCEKDDTGRTGTITSTLAGTQREPYVEDYSNRTYINECGLRNGLIYKNGSIFSGTIYMYDNRSYLTVKEGHKSSFKYYHPNGRLGVEVHEDYNFGKTVRRFYDEDGYQITPEEFAEKYGERLFNTFGMTLE